MLEHDIARGEMAEALAARWVENHGGDRALRDFPQFRWAQQAMLYLVINLTPTQLDMMFDKDRKAAGFSADGWARRRA